jgi:hypothetical protein
MGIKVISMWHRLILYIGFKFLYQTATSFFMLGVYEASDVRRHIYTVPWELQISNKFLLFSNAFGSCCLLYLNFFEGRL